jgi:hypothetical protein
MIFSGDLSAERMSSRARPCAVPPRRHSDCRWGSRLRSARRARRSTLVLARTGSTSRRRPRQGCDPFVARTGALLESVDETRQLPCGISERQWHCFIASHASLLATVSGSSRRRRRNRAPRPLRLTLAARSVCSPVLRTPYRRSTFAGCAGSARASVHCGVPGRSLHACARDRVACRISPAPRPPQTPLPTPETPETLQRRRLLRACSEVPRTAARPFPLRYHGRGRSLSRRCSERPQTRPRASRRNRTGTRVDVPSERDIDGRRRPSGMRAQATVEPVIACTRGDADRATSGRERDTVSEQLDDPRVAGPGQHRGTRHVSLLYSRTRNGLGKRRLWRHCGGGCTPHMRLVTRARDGLAKLAKPHGHGMSVCAGR